MPNPEDVNPAKFTVDTIIYNHDDFSIAYGTWHPSDEFIIAMRWNEGEDGMGYPKTFGWPQWFVVSNQVRKSLLIGLLNNSDLSEQEFSDILKTLGKI